MNTTLRTTLQGIARWLNATGRFLGSIAVCAVRWLIWAVTRTSRLLWRFRLPIVMTLMIPGGAALEYYVGQPLLQARPAQEQFYNKAIGTIRTQLAYQYFGVTSLKQALPDLEQSLAAYEEQLHAGIWRRFLWGRPNPEYAAQALLKEGVIMLMNAGQDQKQVLAAKRKLEQAVAINPGIPYASQLLLGAGDLDSLALEALAAQRDLEMLYQSNPQQRTPQPDKKKGKGEGQKGKRDDNNQKGKPDKPAEGEHEGKPDKDKKDGQHAQQIKPIYQNQNQVDGRGSNDGI